MRYVLLRCFDYEGKEYEHSFESVKEAEDYINSSNPDFNDVRYSSWELWDTDSNEEVLEFNYQYDNHILAYKTWIYLGEVRDV